MQPPDPGPGHRSGIRRYGERLCASGVVAVLVLGMWPVENRFTRLAVEYVKALRGYDGVRYVWGGEGFLGMDCSGLVRKGLIRGEFGLGFRTLDGHLIRDAIALWWHDSSALALRDGFRGRTRELFREDGISLAATGRLRAGDLAVTADGVHVMAYLGDHKWIAADPGVGKVVQITLPTENPWFSVPVVFVRWSSLEQPSPRAAAVAPSTQPAWGDHPKARGRSG